MKVIIIGNGILSLMTALRLIDQESHAQIEIVGPFHRPGSASLAAAAMLNSYCEVSRASLRNPVLKRRFQFHQRANKLWPKLLIELGKRSQIPIRHGFGTILLASQEADEFEATIAALEEAREFYESISTKEIPGYKPRIESAKAIRIPSEGWLNPFQLVEALEKILRDSGRVNFRNATCETIHCHRDLVHEIQLDTGSRVQGDWYLLAAGASLEQILKKSNIRLPLSRVRYGVGTTVLVDSGKETVVDCLRMAHHQANCGTYLVPQREGKTLLGATSKIVDVPCDDPDAIEQLIAQAVRQIHHQFDGFPVIAARTGWRPVSDDGLPLLGKTSIANLVLASGTHRDGLQAAPLISLGLVDLIRTGETMPEFRDFLPERKPLSAEPSLA